MISRDHTWPRDDDWIRNGLLVRRSLLVYQIESLIPSGWFGSRRVTLHFRSLSTKHFVKWHLLYEDNLRTTELRTSYEFATNGLTAGARRYIFQIVPARENWMRSRGNSFNLGIISITYQMQMGFWAYELFMSFHIKLFASFSRKNPEKIQRNDCITEISGPILEFFVVEFPIFFCI